MQDIRKGTKWINTRTKARVVILSTDQEWEDVTFRDDDGIVSSLFDTTFLDYYVPITDQDDEEDAA